MSDPPDLNVQTHLPEMRQWRLMGNGITEVQTIKVFAVRRNGTRRALVPAIVQSGLLNYETIAASDELLELRTGKPMSAPPPVILHRRIALNQALALQRTPAFVELQSDFIGVVYEDGSSERFSLDGESTQSQSVTSIPRSNGHRSTLPVLGAFTSRGRHLERVVAEHQGRLLVALGGTYEVYIIGLQRAFSRA